MANIKVRDGDSSFIYMKASGAGSDVDPHVLKHGLDDSLFSSGGGFEVSVQDQHSELVDLLLMQEEGNFTLAAGVSISDTAFTATAGHGITTGKTLCIQEGTAVYQAIVLNVVTDTITVDTPFDYAFTTSASCCRGITNMNVDGSVTPQIFRITPKNLTDGASWDIIRVIFQITDGSAMDTSKFGGISALTNGIVLRSVNGTSKNIFNVKTNGQFELRAYDISYSDKAPVGQYGFACRRTFGGQSKNGVVIRLDSTSDDELQLIIQDDLTELTTMSVAVQGHIVED